jgi:Effector Associated Constant Component 1
MERSNRDCGEGSEMDLTLAMRGGEPDGLIDLREWLLEDPELRGGISVARRAPRAGEMGALADVLIVAAGAGGAVTVLFESLKTWFAQPRRSDVEIEVRTPEGRTVVVDAKRVAQPQELVREVLRHGD